MFKNVASQSIALFAFDTTTGAAKTGDASNMVFYITKDWGTVTAISSNSGAPTEMDSTNAKGWYKIAVSQTETNADAVVLSGKSSTSNISVVGALIQTVPANFTTQSIDGSGRVDVIKIAGTTQTARDIGANVLLSAGSGTGQLDFTSGVVKANLTQILATALTETSGQLAGAFKQWFNVAAPTGTVNSIPNAVAGASNGLLIAGTNAATSVAITGNITGNLSGSVGSLTTNNDKTGYALTSGERNSVADAMLDRDMSTGTDSGSTTVRTMRQALRFLRNKWAISTGTLTVYKEDDATSSWTATVTTDASADPITSNDPAGP